MDSLPEIYKIITALESELEILKTAYNVISSYEKADKNRMRKIVYELRRLRKKTNILKDINKK